MKRFAVFSTLAALVGMAAPALGQGYLITQVSKATLGTNPIMLWMNTNVEPDCGQSMPATLTVLEPPTHGSAKIDSQPFFYQFPVGDARSTCNKTRVPGNRAFYQAEPGYVGHDHLVLQGFQPKGQVRRIEVDIDVRPVS